MQFLDEISQIVVQIMIKISNLIKDWKLVPIPFMIFYKITIQYDPLIFNR